MGKKQENSKQQLSDNKRSYLYNKAGIAYPVQYIIIYFG